MLITVGDRSTSCRWVSDFNHEAALDAVVAAVGHIQVALSVNHHSIGIEELTRIGAIKHAAFAGLGQGGNWSTGVPSAANLIMRQLSESEMYMFPSRSTATPLGKWI